MFRPKPIRIHEPGIGELRDRITLAARGKWPAAEVTSLQRLAGGASGLTYLAELLHAPETRAVVKVAPAGLSTTRHRDVLRQARVLEALAGVEGVPAPSVLFTAEGAASPLVAMSFCEGEACEPHLDDRPPTASPGALATRSRRTAGILAAMHAASELVSALGGDEPISLTTEISRWDRALSTLPREFGLDWSRCSRRLRETAPQPEQPRLTHGDFRLGNVLCTGPKVVVVVDWEIWALGDRRTDLGWFLLSLDAALHPAAVRNATGVLSRVELIEEYMQSRGEPVERVEWFIALALYKFAATTGLIGKHALRRGDTSSWGVRMLPRLQTALRRVDDLLELA